MGYSIFYPYSGMDDKFFKNIYALDGFSNILVVKTNYLVSTEVENGLIKLFLILASMLTLNWIGWFLRKAYASWLLLSRISFLIIFYVSFHYYHHHQFYHEPISTQYYRGNIYWVKVNNRNIRKRLCSKLKIKRQERCQWRLFGVFKINFEHISRLFLMFLLLTLNK